MKKLDWSGCLSGTPTRSSPVGGDGLWATGVLTSLQARSPGNCGCGGSSGCAGHGGRTGGTGVSEKASDRNEAGSTVSTRGLSGGTSEDEEETSTSAPFWERPSVGVVWEEEATACERFVPPGEGVGSTFVGSNKVSRRPDDLNDDMDDAQERAQAEYLEEAWSAYRCGGKTSAAGCAIGNPCEVLPPCVDPRTAEDFWSMDMPPETLLFDLKWTKEPDADTKWWTVTLLSAVSALLVENVDVIEWLEARVTSRNGGNQRDKITSRVRKRRRKSIRLCVDKKKCNDSFSVTGGVFSIPMYGIWVDAYLKPWMRPGGNPTDVDRLCVAIELTATILHELLHVDYASLSNKDKPGTCEESYLIENMFRWAMYQRYPEALGSVFVPMEEGVEASLRVDVDWMWGYDHAIYPDFDDIGNEVADDLRHRFAW
jgi:hypothetical protein